jgi:hypothetical protein
MCLMPAMQLAWAGWIPECVLSAQRASHFVAYLNINNYLSRFCSVLVLFQVPSGNGVWNHVCVAHCFFSSQGALFAISIAVFTASVIGLGAIVSAKPLDALGYKGWDADKKSFYSPYATSMYLGWALSSTIAVLVTGVIPIVAWFATYRFSPCSALCVGLSASMSYLIFSQTWHVDWISLHFQM